VTKDYSPSKFGSARDVTDSEVACSNRLAVVSVR